MDILKLDLSRRAFNCLKRSGILTIKDLTNTSEYELRHIPKLGTASINQIKSKLDQRGLRLKI